MHWIWFLIGLVIMIVGAIVLSGVTIPHVTWRLNDAFAYIPINATYTSIGVIIVGLLIAIFGGFRQKLGKYFKYY
ncbi:MAG: hypothetical protein M1433_01710 [Candidatus Parvarchaeota archaeon]|nr:hypothetical protein [Candidatus Parvarchaeota archaeon]